MTVEEVKLREDLLSHWADTVRGFFPPDAEFHMRIRNFKQQIIISWPLHDDPKRPNKHSREIVLSFPKSTVEDYDDAPDHDKQRADRRLRDFVAWKLRTFDSRNDGPYGSEPSDEWVVPTDINYYDEPVFS